VKRTTRLTLALALISVPFAIPSLSAERTLVAEGSYAIGKAGSVRPYDSWKLWKESDGSFSAEVDAGSAAGIAGRLVQTFKFDQQFLPSGYALSIARVQQGDTISMACHLESTTLTCDTEFEGKKSSTSTKVKGPSLVMVDDFPGLDLAWFSAAGLRIFDVNKHLGTVAVYVLKEKSLGQMSLELDSKGDQFVFGGDETVQILGKPQTVRRYQFGDDEVWVVDVLSNGLVASMSLKGVPGSGFRLAEYKEYANWAP
jgi:hypothetical protein